MIFPILSRSLVTVFKTARHWEMYSDKSTEELLQLLVRLYVSHVLPHESVLPILSSSKRSSFMVLVFRVQFMHVTTHIRQ
jgi:hypothetical protein